MSTPRIHCPLCDTTDVNGQGAIVLDGAPLVQYRCQGCGELFFQADRRGESPTSPQPD